jgi:hypothetical protein
MSGKDCTRLSYRQNQEQSHHLLRFRHLCNSSLLVFAVAFSLI